MKDALIVVCLIAAFFGVIFAAGWGLSAAFPEPCRTCGATKPQRHVPASTNGGGYHTETVTLDGRPLTCLLKRSTDVGNVYAISCDWVAYHQDGTPGGFRP